MLRKYTIKVNTFKHRENSLHKKAGKRCRYYKSPHMPLNNILLKNNITKYV